MPTRCALTLARCAVLLVLPWIGGCAPPSEAGAPRVPKVTVAHPIDREITDYDEFSGWLDASETVEVRSRVRGHIQKVHFADGDIVQEGDPLFDLDPAPLVAERDRAVEQKEIYVAQLEVAQKDLERQKELFARRVSTEIDVETAQAAVKVLQAQLAASDQEILRRELDVGFATLRAEIGGRISRAMLSRGNLVGAGGSDPLLTTIVSLDPIQVYFYVDERTLQRYQKTSRPADAPPAGGQLRERKLPFQFALETDKGYPHEGLLDFAENRVDPTTGTIQVRGEVKNPKGLLVPGSRVRVRVAVGEPYQATLVPDSAILSDQDKRYLLVLNEKDVVLRRDVALGRLLDDGLRVVLPAPGAEQSVAPKDRVVVLGLQQARVNYPVEPVDDQGNPAGS